jgi:hydrogenase maturation protease
MNAPRPLLVAGIGNIFFGDDAFGSEVARELLRETRPGNVRVEDFGIRSYDLAYALMDGVDAVLIDAVPRGGSPGTVYLIEPDLQNLGSNRGPGGSPDAHTMSLTSVLLMVESLGGQTGKLYLVGCEPATLESPDGHIGLSAPVRAAVPVAAALVERVIDDLIHDRNPVRSCPAETAKEVNENVL